jgi:hypothetical protein
MRNVMRLAHFGEHPDYDAKETAQFWHNSCYTALHSSCAYRTLTHYRKGTMPTR